METIRCAMLQVVPASRRCLGRSAWNMYQVNQSNNRPDVPRVFRKLRFPNYVTMAQDGGKVVSLTHRQVFSPRKSSWYSFLLDAESTPRPKCNRKDYVNEKFQWHYLVSNQRYSDLYHSTLTTVLMRSPNETCTEVINEDSSYMQAAQYGISILPNEYVYTAAIIGRQN